MQRIMLLTRNDLLNRSKEKPINAIGYYDFNGGIYPLIQESDRVLFFDKNAIKHIKNRRGHLGPTKNIKDLSAEDLLLLFT